MKILFQAFIALVSLISLSTTYAYPQAQDGAKILQDKAMSYALYSAQHANFNTKAASRELSQNALDLGKIYSGNYQLQLADITVEQCVDEVTQLGIDSENFINKAIARQYKTIVTADGNVVMLIAGGAGELTYIVINQGKYCTIDKSRHDAYWSAAIIRLAMDKLDVMFS
jgi:hypothetical protein